ncbi:MAG TPA: hypothetical protein VFM18_08010, partial [Methanosarcina sp.]|nr:hypothetical protein [Methanosarcina sp.]
NQQGDDCYPLNLISLLSLRPVLFRRVCCQRSANAKHIPRSVEARFGNMRNKASSNEPCSLMKMLWYKYAAGLAVLTQQTPGQCSPVICRFDH